MLKSVEKSKNFESMVTKPKALQIMFSTRKTEHCSVFWRIEKQQYLVKYFWKYVEKVKNWWKNIEQVGKCSNALKE